MLNLLKMASITLNKVNKHTLSDISFDILPESIVSEIYRDGRVFSHFIERWAPLNYPLDWVAGCKKYDFKDRNNENIIYDEKTFTKGGCRFMPSNMIGQGRKFDEEVFLEKAKSLIYMIVDNNDFPIIRIKFVNGSELAAMYPKGSIPYNDRNKFFEIS